MLPLLLTPLTYIPVGKDARIAKKEILKCVYNNDLYLCELRVFARVILFGQALLDL